VFKLKFLVISVLVFSTHFVHAEAGGGAGFGINLGVGIPFITQAGVNYQISDRFGVSAGYNLLDLDVDEASAKLSMPEVIFNYHPFQGSFFLGAGLGKEDFEVTAIANGGINIKAEVDATTTIFKLGWMWGAADGGFWYGVDVSYITPSSPTVKITAPGVPESDPNYMDVVEAVDKLGRSSYPNITAIRLGYMF